MAKSIITLKAIHHAIIIGLYPEKESIDKINYILQCTKIWGDGSGYDPEQMIETVIDDNLIVYTFDLMADKQSGVVSVINDQIEALLMPQLMTQEKDETERQDLLRRISEVVEKNRGRRKEHETSGVKFATSIQIPI